MNEEPGDNSDEDEEHQYEKGDYKEKKEEKHAIPYRHNVRMFKRTVTPRGYPSLDISVVQQLTRRSLHF